MYQLVLYDIKITGASNTSTSAVESPGPDISTLVVGPHIAGHHFVGQSLVTVLQGGEEDVALGLALLQHVLHVTTEGDDEDNLDSLLTNNLSPPLISSFFSVEIFRFS